MLVQDVFQNSQRENGVQFGTLGSRLPIHHSGWRHNRFSKGTAITGSANPKNGDAIQILRAIGRLDEKLTDAQAPIQHEMQDLLERLRGQQFGSLAANRRVVDAMRDLLNRLQLRVACTREDCGRPSVLLCKNVTGMKFGAFQFQHQQDGRLVTHTASSTIPKLILVKPAKDRRRNSTYKNT